MAKLIKPPASVKSSWRVSAMADGHVRSLAERTGWSEAKAATFLLEVAGRVLWATAHSRKVTLRNLEESRALAKLAQDRRDVELHAEAAVKLARSKEAAAKKVLVAGGAK